MRIDRIWSAQLSFYFLFKLSSRSSLSDSHILDEVISCYSELGGLCGVSVFGGLAIRIEVPVFPLILPSILLLSVMQNSTHRIFIHHFPLEVKLSYCLFNMITISGIKLSIIHEITTAFTEMRIL